ncbi:hypothetical protein [Staphylococcus sp. EGD-HP3]|uniref:hypothetical protein n=1 Tax=Staphylococcus sp. EGD-HP3 TaxID=1357269 RepID=UPI00041D6A86|nr:hypothetical protein [Staphylococcus sp. EGD-HP3]
MTNNFRYDKKKRVASGDYYGGDIMNNDYISRPEFELHQKHMDTRFDAIEDKMNLNNEILSKEIKEAVSSLKEEINDKKITTNRFWIGISIPALISVIGIIISIFY